VPSDDSIWFDDQEDIGPARPKVPHGGPKQPVAGVEWRPWSLAFEHGYLLAESKNLQADIGSCPEESAECHEGGEGKRDHELTVLTCRNTMPPARDVPAQLIDFTIRRVFVYR
jgi:hypothetical protein